MSTADCRFDVYEPTVNSPLLPERDVRPLQRLAEVQREQSVSDRTLAGRLQLTIEALRRQQSPYCDLLLSELYRWQAALDVPVADLLVEPGPSLAPVVERRARLVKVMKTVRSLQLAAKNADVGVLVEHLAEQLVELMPELIHVDSWPLVGKRRATTDIAPIEERMLPDLQPDGARPSERERD